MLRTQISLLGIIFLAVFIETVLIPGVWSTLRIDLFIGMIIGIIIQMSFSQGLAFVIVASIILQAFSGARPGLIPMIYLCTYLIVYLLKGIVYMENVFTQLILAMVIYILAACSLVVSLDLNLTWSELIPLTTGAVLTGLISPLMVVLVDRLKKAYEA
jgi:predicted neutral ceramidase superfamily lipid hydrolase